MAGPECCIPAPAAQHCCTGKEEIFGPFLSYVVTSHPSPTAAVIVVSDVFGFRAPLLRKLADKIASAGYFVVVPDCFDNDPFIPSYLDNEARRVDWISRNPPSKLVEPCKQAADIMKTKGFGSVGAVGFCWGAKVVVELAKGDWLKAAILAHPGFVTVEDMQDVKSPIAILGAEIDQHTPPALVKQFAEVLELKPEVRSFVHVYPGVSHGWVIRYDPSDEKEAASAEEAHEKILQWFGSFLN